MQRHLQQQIEEFAVLEIAKKLFNSRLFAQQILSVGNEIGRLPPQFGDASKVANAIVNAGFEYDSGKLYFNRFK